MSLGKAAVTCTCYSHFSCYAFSLEILVPFSGPCEIILNWKPQMVQFNIAPQTLFSWMLTVLYFFFPTVHNCPFRKLSVLAYCWANASRRNEQEARVSIPRWLQVALMSLGGWPREAGRRGEERMALGKAVDCRFLPECTCGFPKDCHPCQYFMVVVLPKLYILINTRFSYSKWLREYCWV